MRTACSVPGCDAKHKARGLCHHHYNQLKNRGLPPYRRWVEPRYCNCYGDVPAPDVNGMCPDCLRLAEHRATA
jgi:hypothetical protein